MHRVSLRSPWNHYALRLVVHSLTPGKTVGADLSCTLPIYRLWLSPTHFPNAPLLGLAPLHAAQSLFFDASRSIY